MQATTAMASAVVVPRARVVPHRVGERVRVKGFELTEHFFTVPLDHFADASDSAETQIEVFAREVVAASKVSDPAFDRSALPALLFLQGGPGFEAARPTEAGGWLAEAAKQFRVFLLDQRGTGRSTRVTNEMLERAFGTLSSSDDDDEAEESSSSATTNAVANYVASHRADAIVADAECVRFTILGRDKKWTLLGQSFGGFCITRYLSVSPEGVREALLTGGLPPLIRTTDDPAYGVYLKLLERVARQNEKFYKRFPNDAARVLDVARFVSDSKRKIVTPGGSTFSLRGLQSLGFSNLGIAGGFEKLHYLFETAWEGEGDDKTLSYAFLKAADDAHAFDTNPLYAVAHESIYCNGAGVASDWAAERALIAYNAVNDGVFDAEKALLRSANNNDAKVYFTGEMVFPFMFDEFARLRPLRGVARALSRKTDWPALYCADTLNKNAVPVACASYVEDAFVDWDLAGATAREIRGARVWSTSEYMHSGVREDGAKILQKLLELARDEDPLR
jgi:pimeloyl-ACP methyl ester carboxylesterase